VTPQIALVLGILFVSLVLFVTEKVRMDVVALLVLGALAVTGLVTPTEALAGFSNPAVITVWAMFMISGALAATGVAGIFGQHLLRLVGRSEGRMVAVIMLTSGVLSAFMNNIGVAALLLPVTMDVARRVGRPPSRLLMPLAYGSLLGGLTTLIGTPPNLLISQALHENGFERFGLFDFTPVGGVILLAGVAFTALIGRRWLPARDIGREASEGRPTKLTERYAVEERMVVMRLRAGSPLAGRTLRECRLGSATGLSVVAVIRGGQTRAAPGPGHRLEPGDGLLVGGRLDRLEELRGWRQLVFDREAPGAGRIVSDEVTLVELCIPPGSSLAGTSLSRTDSRRKLGGIALALGRTDEVLHTDLADTELKVDDRLLVQARRDRLESVATDPDVKRVGSASPDELAHAYGLDRSMFQMRVPCDSVLVGKSLAECRLGDALGLGVVGIVREGKTRLLPGPDERLVGGDDLLVRGSEDALEVFHGLQQLETDEQASPPIEILETVRTGLAEVILSPRTSLVGATLRQLDFRERYGVHVLAILREGRAIRSNLQSIPLRFGDALLLFGRHQKLQIVGSDPEFVVLTRTAETIASKGKAALSGLILVATLVPVLAGWLPISVAAVAGAALLLLTRCLDVDEAYRVVEWKSVFLIAGMLPLGTAMQHTGAANLIAEGMLSIARPLGPWAAVVGLYLVTAIATTIIPTAALVVLIAPIALQTAAEMGISSHTVMMAVAIAASASFTSPIAHPANVLVMGPGGYRFVDYVKLGLPLALVVFVVTLFVLPVFWPL